MLNITDAKILPDKEEDTISTSETPSIGKTLSIGDMKPVKAPTTSLSLAEMKPEESIVDKAMKVADTIGEGFTRFGQEIKDQKGPEVLKPFQAAGKIVASVPAKVASSIATIGPDIASIGASLVGAKETAKKLEEGSVNTAKEFDRYTLTKPDSAMDTAADLASIVTPAIGAAKIGKVHRLEKSLDELEDGTKSASSIIKEQKSLKEAIRTGRDAAIGEAVGGAAPGQSQGSITALAMDSEQDSATNRRIVAPLEGFGIGSVVDTTVGGVKAATQAYKGLQEIATVSDTEAALATQFLNRNENTNIEYDFSPTERNKFIDAYDEYPQLTTTKTVKDKLKPVTPVRPDYSDNIDTQLENLSEELSSVTKVLDSRDTLLKTPTVANVAMARKVDDALFGSPSAAYIGKMIDPAKAKSSSALTSTMTGTERMRWNYMPTRAIVSTAVNTSKQITATEMEKLYRNRRVTNTGTYTETKRSVTFDQFDLFQQLQRQQDEAAGIKPDDKAFNPHAGFIPGVLTAERIGRLRDGMLGLFRGVGKQHKIYRGIMSYDPTLPFDGMLRHNTNIKNLSEIFADGFEAADLAGVGKNEVAMYLQARNAIDDYTNLSRAFKEQMETIVTGKSKDELLALRPLLQKIEELPIKESPASLAKAIEEITPLYRNYPSSTLPDIKKLVEIGSHRSHMPRSQAIEYYAKYKDTSWGRNISNDLSSYNKHWLDLQEWSGWITPQQKANYLKAHPNYVPSYKVIDDYTGSNNFDSYTSSVKNVNRERGISTRENIDPLAAMYKYGNAVSERIETAAATNNMLNYMIKSLDDDAWKYVFWDDKQQVLKAIDDLKAGKIDNWGDKTVERYDSSIFRIGGGTLRLRVRDQDFYNATAYQSLRGWNDRIGPTTARDINKQKMKDAGVWTRGLSKASDAFRFVTTLTPQFLIKTVYKETVDKFVNAIGPVTSRINLKETGKSIVAPGVRPDDYIFYIANYGFGDARVGWREGVFGDEAGIDNLKDTLRAIGGEGFDSSSMTGVMNTLYGFAQYADVVPRMSYFNQLSKSGMNQQEAMWLSLNQGVNFSRRGNRSTVTIPLLINGINRNLPDRVNIPIGAMYKLPFFRTYVNSIDNHTLLMTKRTKSYFKGAAFVAGGFGMYNVMTRDPDQPDSTRITTLQVNENKESSPITPDKIPNAGFNTSIWASTGETVVLNSLKYLDDNYNSVILDAAAVVDPKLRDTLEQKFKQDAKGTRQIIGTLLAGFETLYTPPLPIIGPTSSLVTGKDYKGDDIVPAFIKSQAKGDVTNEYDARTSIAVRDFIKASGLDISPMKAEYFARNIFATASNYAVDAVDRIYRSTLEDNDPEAIVLQRDGYPPFASWPDPLGGSFYHNDKYPVQKFSGRFSNLWKQANSANQQIETMKEAVAKGDETPAMLAQTMDDNRDNILLYNTIRPYIDQLKPLYKAQEDIRMGRNTSLEKDLQGFTNRYIGNKEKADAIDEIQRQIQIIHKTAIEAVSQLPNGNDFIAGSMQQGSITRWIAKKYDAANKEEPFVPYNLEDEIPSITMGDIKRHKLEEVFTTQDVQLMNARLPEMDINPEVLLTFAQIESHIGENPNTYRKKGVTGIFQFQKDTFEGLVDMYGKHYTIVDSDGNSRPIEYKDINNDQAQWLMAGEMLKENYGAYQQTFGKNPSLVDMYVGHFLGMGDMLNFFDAYFDPKRKNLPAYSVVPTAAAANPNRFKNKSVEEAYLGIVQEVDKALSEVKQKTTTNNKKG